MSHQSWRQTLSRMLQLHWFLSYASARSGPQCFTFYSTPTHARSSDNHLVQAGRDVAPAEEPPFRLPKYTAKKGRRPECTHIQCSKKIGCCVSQREMRAGVERRSYLSSGFASTALAAGLWSGSSASQAATRRPMRVEQEVWAPLDEFNDAQGGSSSQKTYTPKFIAYLARLLINYDYASMRWWQRKMLILPESAQRISRLLASKGFDDTFTDLDEDSNGVISKDELKMALSDPLLARKREQELLSQFQASVNFGLRRYQGKDGVQQLARLLRSEFGLDRTGKRQLALLFSLMDTLQPVDVIRQLLGESENTSIVALNVTYPGFGYNAETPPKVTVSPSPGSNVSARAQVRLTPTGRILRVALDGSVPGFSVTPKVEISPPANGTRAQCIPKMNGDMIEKLVVSNPGSGYTAEDRVAAYISIEGPTGPWVITQARPLLEMKVQSLQIEEQGSGYAHDVPIKVQIDRPPFPISPLATARATAILSEPRELILRSWLPPTSADFPVTGLLPSNLAPRFDPCVERFIISPVEELDPNYCIYFEDEFRIVPTQKFNKYFSFLDGPKPRDPVEKERELDSSVFMRFAACGALCCATAHAFLIPLDVVKTKMQADPKKYPSFVHSTQKLWREGGVKTLMLGAKATIFGYLVYGAVSFGLTEFFKRKFFELAGPEYATFYPFAILLFASISAAFFGAVAVTPFEALRIRSVTTDGAGGGLVGSIGQMANQGALGQLYAGLGPAVVGEIPFMMAKFAVFDAVSKAIYAMLPTANESITLSLLVSLLSGMTAGVAAAVVSHPFDTLITRVNQYSQTGQGAGLLKAVRDTYAEGGVGGFFSGTLPRAVKSAANIAIQFFMYDFSKRALHVSSDDLKLFFDVMSGLCIGTTVCTDPTAAALATGELLKK